jgi:hypothetical protein
METISLTFHLFLALTMTSGQTSTLWIQVIIFMLIVPPTCLLFIYVIVYECRMKWSSTSFGPSQSLPSAAGVIIDNDISMRRIEQQD